jgi:hypothetical protein
VRDGFKGIFDLVQAAFWREDGRLCLLLAAVSNICGCGNDVPENRISVTWLLSIPQIGRQRGYVLGEEKVVIVCGELAVLSSSRHSSYASAVASLGTDHFLNRGNQHQQLQSTTCNHGTFNR